MSNKDFVGTIEDLVNTLKDHDSLKKLCEVIETGDFNENEDKIIRCIGIIRELSSVLNNVEDNLISQYKLGKYHELVTKNEDKMEEHYNNCIASGDLRGAINLAEYYKEKYNTLDKEKYHTLDKEKYNTLDKENHNTSDNGNLELEKYKNKTIENYLIAKKYEELGFFYDEYLDLPDRAIEYHEKSGTANSYYNISLIYKNRSAEKYVEYLKLSLVLGKFESAYKLFEYYNIKDNEGEGKNKGVCDSDSDYSDSDSDVEGKSKGQGDGDEHIKYLIIATNNDNIYQHVARFNLVVHYYDIKDYKTSEKYALEGIKLLENLSLELQHERKYFNLLYMVGLNNHKRRDFNTALTYYIKATKGNHLLSFHGAGLVFEYRNEDKYAIEIYEKGSNLGEPNCMYRLGELYVKKGNKDGLKYLEKSAELNHLPALESLIRIHTRGSDKPFEKAKTYMLKMLGMEDIKCFGNIISSNQFNSYQEIINLIIEKEDLGESFSEDFETKFKKIIQSQYIDKNLEYFSKCILCDNNNIIYKHIYNTYVKNNIKCELGFISDFKINVMCNGTIYEYYLHSIVLNSEYFKTMIESRFTGTKEINITVSDLSIITCLIEYLYLNKLSIHIKFIDELISLSREYMFIDLRRTCMCLKYLDNSKLNKYFPTIFTD